MDEAEFFQWVKKIQSLKPATTPQSLDEEAGLDLIAAFRVFDRDKNGFITKVMKVLMTVVRIYSTCHLIGRIETCNGDD